MFGLGFVAVRLYNPYYIQDNACDILDSHLSCLKYGPQMKGTNTFQNSSSVPLMRASSLCFRIATYSNHGGQ